MQNAIKIIIAISMIAIAVWAVTPNTDPCGDDAACIKYMNQLNDGVKD